MQIRTIAVAISVSMLTQTVTSAFAFRDVGTATNYQEAIQTLEKKGVIQGYADNSFRPQSGINRVEFLKILLEAKGQEIRSKTNCFPDVGDEWFASYVCTAKEEGIVSGYPDGTFKPSNLITFPEASKMLALAYDQQVQETNGQWYEGYGQALESSRAIPPTIESLEEPLKRGEMAEMMWRLSEQRTDQPSKGLLNVRYPDMTVNLASDLPQKAGSCSDLRAFTEAAQSSYPQPALMMRGMMNDGIAAPAMMESKSVLSPTDSTGVSGDFSATNIQVAGVDEADRVKTDGQYVYILSRRDGTVRIVDVRRPADLNVVSSLTFDDFTPQDLYIDGSRLVITGHVQSNQQGVMPMMEDSVSAKMMIYPPMWQMQKSGVRIFDVSDKLKPVLMRSVAFEGSVLSSRLVDGQLLLALNSGVRWSPFYKEKKNAISDALLPVYDDSMYGVTEKPVVDCNDVTIIPRVPRPEYLVIASIPVQTSTSVQRSVILGNAQNVYVSLRNMYLTSADWSYSWNDNGGSSHQNTTIYRFSYTKNGVTFQAQGSVPGHLLNQFSMDEHGETFRVATTKNPEWSPDGTTVKKSTNNVYVLSLENLEKIGAIEDIAPGESIYSVRFLGNRGYMVTFKQVDPLFVLDFSSPRNPKILGKLKIPGYSNYLHPVDEDHILGFGKEVDESIDKDKVHTEDAVYFTAIQGMKIALFDVSDVENPKEIHKEVIGARGTDSPLLYDHKALLFDAERGLLAFPVTVFEARSTPKSNEWTPDTVPVFQGVYVYDFLGTKGFKLKGTISHHSSDEFLKSGDYWYDQAGLDIDRVLRIGENLFAISEAKITSNPLMTLKTVGSTSLAKESRNYELPVAPMDF